jgi:hypothetical protein
MSDLLPVCQTARAFNCDENDWRGIPYVDYEFADIGLWNDFQTKWKIPPVFTFGLLLNHTSGSRNTVLRGLWLIQLFRKNTSDNSQ